MSSIPIVFQVYASAALSDDWAAEAAKVVEALSLVGIVGRCHGGTGAKLHPRLWKRARVVGRDFVQERFVHDNGQPTIYRQPEGSFSNPNGAVNVKVLDWLARLARRLGEESGGKSSIWALCR